MIVQRSRWSTESRDSLPIDTIFYTPPVINSPARIESDLRGAREQLAGIAREPIEREAAEVLTAIRLRDEERRRAILDTPGRSPCDHPPPDPAYLLKYEEYDERKRAIGNPATLILIDEADRLRMTSLEQVRSLFDEGGAGVVLIGMPGIEKRMARFPQFYSRIGFVHEFRPLGALEMRELLGQRWTPPGVTLPPAALSEEVIATVIRMTGGNFRLLHRLLTQVERVLEINRLGAVSKEVVEAARESLVIGQG
jgi:hypothetical protein